MVCGTAMLGRLITGAAGRGAAGAMDCPIAFLVMRLLLAANCCSANLGIAGAGGRLREAERRSTSRMMWIESHDYLNARLLGRGFGEHVDAGCEQDDGGNTEHRTEVLTSIIDRFRFGLV